MAIKSIEEIMNSVRAQLGEDTSDSALSLIEDVSDTLNDMSARANSDPENWEQRYKDLDAEWRKRYHDRFFGAPEKEPEEPPKKEQPTTFESLFTEKKG